MPFNSASGLPFSLNLSSSCMDQTLIISAHCSSQYPVLWQQLVEKWWCVTAASVERWYSSFGRCFSSFLQNWNVLTLLSSIYDSSVSTQSRQECMSGTDDYSNFSHNSPSLETTKLFFSKQKNNCGAFGQLNIIQFFKKCCQDLKGTMKLCIRMIT